MHILHRRSVLQASGISLCFFCHLEVWHFHFGKYTLDMIHNTIIVLKCFKPAFVKNGIMQNSADPDQIAP